MNTSTFTYICIFNNRLALPLCSESVRISDCFLMTNNRGELGTQVIYTVNLKGTVACLIKTVFGI